MKKPMFFLFVVLLAVGGMLQGCDEVTDTPAPTPTYVFQKQVTPTTSPDFGAGRALYPPFSPFPVPLPGLSSESKQAPFSLPLPQSEKSLVIFVLDVSSSMKACDPDFAKSKPMLGAILRLLLQYYRQSEYASPVPDAPDVLFLTYPNPASQVPLPLGPEAKTFLEKIDSAQFGGPEIFYANMFKKIGDLSKQGKYAKTIVLHWTDGSFLPGEWATDPDGSREQYQKEADAALPANVEWNVFFSCRIPDADSDQWWAAKSQIHWFISTSPDIFADWLLRMRDQAWFQTLFPGLGSQPTWQKWFVFGNGAWHDLSHPGVDVPCAAEKCFFQTSPATTGFVAGLVPVGGGDQELPRLFRDGQPWDFQPPEMFQKDEVFPVSGCMPHDWALNSTDMAHTPFLFFWRGAQDLNNSVSVTPPLPVDIGSGDVTSSIEVTWTARNGLRRGGEESLPPETLEKWLPCYTPVLEAHGQEVLLEHQPGKPLWTSPVQRIVEQLSLRTLPLSKVDLKVSLRYNGLDGAPMPEPSPATWRGVLPVHYSTQIINTTLPCQSSNQSGMGATHPQMTWTCRFILVYAAPEFRAGESPLRVWFDYAPGQDMSLCLAADNSSAIPVRAARIDSNRLSIEETARSQDQTQSFFEVKSVCQPLALHLEVKAGGWQSSPFAAPPAPQNPLNKP